MQVLLQLQQTTESVAGKRTLTSGPDAEEAAATCYCWSAKAAEQLGPPKPEMASARTGTKDSTLNSLHTIFGQLRAVTRIMSTLYQRQYRIIHGQADILIPGTFAITTSY